MGEQLSVINLVVQASVPVQIVIALLMLASLYSWMIIFRKRFMIGRSRREADQFENQFWSGGDLAQLYRAIESRGGSTGMANIFEFGFREFARLRQQAGASADQMLEGARRAMRVGAIEGDRPARAESGDARDRGLHQPLRRFVRHRLGHHECVLLPGECATGDARHGGSRHFGGAHYHRVRSVRGDPGGHRLQPLRRPGGAPGDPFRRFHRGVFHASCSDTRPAAPVTAAWCRPATRVRGEGSWQASTRAGV